jgi:mRNA interferase MazF
MQRGDVVWVDLDPARAGEANKRRPAVIVSNDGANRTADRLGRGVVTVVPVTTNIERIHPFQVLLPATRCDLAHDSKAQAEQIRSVAHDRIGAVVGRLPADLLEELDRALRLHLSL